jgi:hypothetical protein
MNYADLIGLDSGQPSIGAAPFKEVCDARWITSWINWRRHNAGATAAFDQPRQDITLASLRSFQLHSGSSSTTLPTS